MGIVSGRRRALEGEKNGGIEIELIIKGDTPGTDKTNYDSSKEYLKLNKLGKDLVKGINNK